MSEAQRKKIEFVAQHKGHFATPTAAGCVWIYSFASINGRVELVRDLAVAMSDVRSILGY